MQQAAAQSTKFMDLSIKPFIDQLVASKDLGGWCALLDAALDEPAVIDAALSLNTSAVIARLFAPVGTGIRPAVGAVLGAIQAKRLDATLTLLRAVASYEGTLIKLYPRLQAPELRKPTDEDRLAWVVDDDMPPEIGRIFIERFSGLVAALVIDTVAVMGTKLLRWQAKVLVARLEQAQLSQLQLLAALPGMRGQLQGELPSTVKPLPLEEIYAQHEEYRLGVDCIHEKAQAAAAQGATVFQPFGTAEPDDEDA
jgi:hypothetical protein